MRCTLQDIFVRHYPAYAAARTLHSRQQRAAQSISQCYTPALGSHVLKCPEGHYERLQPHACRHRSCPRCVEPARSRWIDSQMLRLLPCAHFHTVFTIPHELLPLWAFNRSQLTQLLFDCARSSLLELMGNRRRLGVLPGLLMSLHTWGRNLSHHPHLHCLVTAGGLDEHGQWKSSRTHVPISAMPLKRLFRGKFLGLLGQSLSHHRLSLPEQMDTAYWRSVIRALYRKDFNVQVGDVYEHGHGVALYLARYVKGGPLPKDRPLFLQDSTVRFEYTDHRDHRTKRMALPVQQFIDRILWHAPPRGQHLTRHAGLYSTPRLDDHARALEQLLLHPEPALSRRQVAQNQPPPIPPEAPRCPTCRVTLLRIRRPRAHHGGESSLSGAISHSPTITPSPRAPPAMSNQSFKLTRHGMAPGPRDAHLHHASRGPGAMPRRAA
jgi:hypothetical protein